MQHEYTQLSIGEIIEMIDDGRMALPQFQRPFVWAPNAVVELIDSLINGWPIGTLLLLRGPQPFASRGIEGGPNDAAINREDFKPNLYILDGQQRITSLYQAFKDTGEPQYLIYLGDDISREENPITWRNREEFPPPSMTFTLATALNPFLFEEAVRSMPVEEQDIARSNREIRLGHLLDRRLLLPVILLNQSIDLDALTRIFETLNRTGTPLDAFDLMVALLYPEEFHLGEQFDEARESNPLLTDYEVAGLEILKLVALWQRDREISGSVSSRPPEKRVRGVRQRDVLNTPPKFVVEQWQAAVSAYVEAIEWIRDHGGISDKDSVPSTAMLLTIAYSLHSGRTSELDMMRWYWHSIAMQTYAQGANTQVITDVEKLKNGYPDTPPWPEAMRAGLLDEARRNRVLRLGMRGLAVMCQLGDPVTGENLHDRVRDISIDYLFKGKVASPPAGVLAERLFLNESSVKILRKQLAGLPKPSGEDLLLYGHGRPLLPHVMKQGFHKLQAEDVTDFEPFAKMRVEFFIDLLCDLLKER